MIDRHAPIYWNGWTTTLSALLAGGWVVSEKPHYSKASWKPGLTCVGHYVYLTHEEKSMFARLSVSAAPREACNFQAYELDFMINRKARNHRRYAPPMSLSERLDQEDVEGLYRLILKLQKRYPQVQPKPLPMAEIIQLTRRAA